MGQLVKGEWSREWYDTSKSGGAFQRDTSRFRNWVTPDGAAHFCAVRGGALTVRAGRVAIATREAVTGDDLERLDREVLSRFRANLDEERVEHVETTRLQLHVMRQMLLRLQQRPRGAGQ